MKYIIIATHVTPNRMLLHRYIVIKYELKCVETLPN